MWRGVYRQWVGHVCWNKTVCGFFDCYAAIESREIRRWKEVCYPVVGRTNRRTGANGDADASLKGSEGIFASRKAWKQGVSIRFTSFDEVRFASHFVGRALIVLATAYASCKAWKGDISIRFTSFELRGRRHFQSMDCVQLLMKALNGNKRPYLYLLLRFHCYRS